MKNVREEYIIDTFVDYAGVERRFIMAAISIDVSDTLCAAMTNLEDEYCVESINKCLALGLAICDPKDEFNEEIGKRIAKGKALSTKSRISTLYSSDKGLINSSVVKAVLKQESEYLKHNPGKYIKRYDKDKETFEYEARIEDLYQAMSEEEKNTVNVLSEASDKSMSEILEVANNLR